jgi:hypothetical protein
MIALLLMSCLVRGVRWTKAIGIKNMLQATNVTRDMTAPSIHINVDLSFKRKLGIGINSGFAFGPNNGKRKREGL